MKIYLVRHGETQWNVESRMQGHEDIPLNENGLDQAEACGRVFESIKAKRIVTSPLKRASKTAEIIGEHMHIQDTELEPLLIERDFGIYSGNKYVKGDSYRDSNGTDKMESLEALFTRMKKFLEKYKLSQDVVVVSHGASINAMLSVISKNEVGLGKTWLKNACISVAEHNHGTWNLLCYNLTAEEFKEFMDDYET